MSDIYCPDALELADLLRSFIHQLWVPTLVIWGCLCVPKVINSVLRGL